MNERLRKLLESEQLSSSAFADIIGVQRSSISHLLAGRNKPSYDFLIKTLEAFPGLRADWLLLGEGSMYKDDFNPSGSVLSGGKSRDRTGDENPGNTVVERDSSTDFNKKESNLFSQSDVFKDVNKEKNSESDPVTGKNRLDNDLNVSQPEKSRDKHIQRVMIFYSDHTFQSYEPE